MVEPLRHRQSAFSVTIMSDYDQEQLDTLRKVRRHMDVILSRQRCDLEDRIAPYMDFRREVARLLDSRFSTICTEACFRNRLSACCTREGIVVFFADVVINALAASPDELDLLERVLEKGNVGFKCVFLGETGCLWRCKPIVCEMFLCEPAREKVFAPDPCAKNSWDRLEEQKKAFTWPDRPVLFDELEKVFLSSGCRSSLMYMNFSPGLLRIKKMAGTDWGKPKNR